MLKEHLQSNQVCFIQVHMWATIRRSHPIESYLMGGAGYAYVMSIA